MGQTVSLGACVTGGSVVRVMNTDGLFESYEFPAVTAEVMLKHPNHLVVHCPPASGRRPGEPKINIMLPDQPLLPGEPYMLYPVPEKHQALLARSKSFSFLKRQMEAKDAGEELSAAPEKKKGRRYALKLVMTRLQLATLVAMKLGHKGDKDQTKVPMLQTTEEEEKRKKAPPQPLEMPLYHWRPALSSIPESPLGFHNIPQTPRGLYKMEETSEDQSFTFFPGQITDPAHLPTPVTVTQ